jgi:hypothetical protein
MTFLERYRNEQTWYGKVIVLEIYHLTMSQRDKAWTIAKTAAAFEISVSLVSENLKIAEAMHKDGTLINCESRVKALRKIS